MSKFELRFLMLYYGITEVEKLGNKKLKDKIKGES